MAQEHCKRRSIFSAGRRTWADSLQSRSTVRAKPMHSASVAIPSRENPMKRAFRTVVAVCVAGLLAVSGCGGSSTSSLSGSVTYDGKPVEAGTLTLNPEGGAGSTYGAAIQDGKYKID